MRLAAALIVAAISARAAPFQSVLSPAGPQSGRIAGLWWFFLALLGAVFIVVMAFLAAALLRGRPGGTSESKLTRAVGLATGITVLALFALFVTSVATGENVIALGSANPVLTVEVTGNQWWWHIRYFNTQASDIVVTANEIHIPTGRPILIRGTSHDVIHSFWAPNLHGKRDLIPSRITTEWIQADQPGEFRAQCAEFCGLQHAHMALWIVAEPEDRFHAWLEQQAKPAAAPSDAVKQRGMEVFMSHACMLCHTISGTPAAGQVAPNLTHLASRKTIAAGTLANTRGNLSGWITDPQSIKPGNHMATIPLAPDDLQALVEYLVSLK